MGKPITLILLSGDSQAALSQIDCILRQFEQLAELDLQHALKAILDWASAGEAKLGRMLQHTSLVKIIFAGLWAQGIIDINITLGKNRAGIEIDNFHIVVTFQDNTGNIEITVPSTGQDKAEQIITELKGAGFQPQDLRAN